MKLNTSHTVNQTLKRLRTQINFHLRYKGIKPLMQKCTSRLAKKKIFQRNQFVYFSLASSFELLFVYKLHNTGVLSGPHGILTRKRKNDWKPSS